MGFDVTAAYVIFFVAALTAGSAALGAYWTSQDQLESAARAQQRLADERVHTNLTITATSYDAGLDKFSVTLENAGSTIVDISELVYLVDGVYVPDAQVESALVTGVAATDIWQPTEEFTAVLTSIVSSPTNFKLVTSSGAAAQWGI